MYDSTDAKIMVILSEDDKKNITNMLPEARGYCSFPEHMETEDVRDWMRKALAETPVK